jgi:hypothetical protein
MYKTIRRKALEILVTGLLIAILALLFLALRVHAEYVITPTSTLGKGQAPNTVLLSVSPSSTISDSSTSSIYQFVIDESVTLGINPALSECIVSHESQWKNRPGDDGESRGIWQVSEVWHPEVSDAVAYSEVSSTIWALNWIAEGHVRQWTTYREYCSDIPVFE